SGAGSPGAGDGSGSSGVRSSGSGSDDGSGDCGARSSGARSSDVGSSDVRPSGAGPSGEGSPDGERGADADGVRGERPRSVPPSAPVAEPVRSGSGDRDSVGVGVLGWLVGPRQPTAHGAVPAAVGGSPRAARYSGTGRSTPGRSSSVYARLLDTTTSGSNATMPCRSLILVR